MGGGAWARGSHLGSICSGSLECLNAGTSVTKVSMSPSYGRECPGIFKICLALFSSYCASYLYISSDLGWLSLFCSCFSHLSLWLNLDWTFRWESTLECQCPSMLNVNREALAVESIEAGGPREPVSTLHFTVVTLGSQRAKTMSSCQPPPPRDLSLDPLFAAAPTLPGFAVEQLKLIASLDIQSLVPLNCLGINHPGWEEYPRIGASHRLLRGNSL